MTSRVHIHDTFYFVIPGGGVFIAEHFQQTVVVYSLRS
jgi:hypothetical protein